MLVIVLLCPAFGFAQNEVPASYSNIDYNDAGELIFTHPETGEVVPAWQPEPKYTLSMIEGSMKGAEKGISFSFPESLSAGKIYFGFIDMRKARIPQPVLFKRPAVISEGKALVDITQLKGKYDFIQWEERGYGRLGYRIAADDGLLVYDGRLSFLSTEPFTIDTAIIEGPFLNMMTHNSLVISFKTNHETRALVEVDGKTFREEQASLTHEIAVEGLMPAREYDYTVKVGDYSESYSFRTAPIPGSRNAFTFAFASDSRAGKGGGEREIFGANAYMMKKIAALALQRKSGFFQFTGDLITGYSTSLDETRLQYANWKRAIEPFWHFMPFMVGMGNHEAVNYIFSNGSGDEMAIDRFPFRDQSTEAIFAENVVNPLNGPVSEDRSKWDPNKKGRDFPSYAENAFHYTWGNVAMIVVNSNYWYAPTEDAIKYTGGNPHGYIMDNQLEWIRETLMQYERDNNIDHVFVTLHTPAFPNGGHAHDDMWYHGNNEIRPWVAGKPVDKGIIERRDEFMDLLINHSTKCVALLCGDEHNYSRLELSFRTRIYPPDWEGKRLNFSRNFWQITNGSAGAPYYAMERLPWSPAVKIFSTQYALCLFHVHGQKITLEVVNPDTLEVIEEVELR